MAEMLAWVSIGIAITCAVWIALDEWREPQAMAVMNVVWPVTALYFSVFAVWAYYRLGKRRSRHAGQKVNAAQVAVGTSHCGAGCMIADVGCGFAIAAAGVTLLGSPLWAEFAIDFVAAWLLGVAFQYWAIQPMRKLPPRQAVWAAVKADTLSILAFQVGMYGWMALVYFKLAVHPHLTAFEPAYWLSMQAGMICGYATSFPMNWFLIRKGFKEAM